MSLPADNSDPRDYVLDISSAAAPANSQPAAEPARPKAAFLSINFKCCNVYAAIYKNGLGTAYAGHCPRCKRAITVPISPTGSTSRIFNAG